MSIDSEEFRSALNYMVNMDDEWGALPMRHTEEKAHEAAMAFLKFVDNYCDNQSVVYQKRIEMLEKSLKMIANGHGCPSALAEDALKP